MAISEILGNCGLDEKASKVVICGAKINNDNPIKINLMMGA